jgi:uncharacterized protein YecE (DUF72 family)
MLLSIESISIDASSAVEARHKSWFDDDVYAFFKQNDICLAWSQLAEIQTPPVIITDFIYLRFIGDPSIDEKDFKPWQRAIT